MPTWEVRLPEILMTKGFDRTPKHPIADGF